MGKMVIEACWHNLTNINKITNADIIAAIDNTQSQETTFEVVKPSSVFNISSSGLGQTINISRDKSASVGKLYYEELSVAIFEEINNVIDVNEKLRKSRKVFLLGEDLYYRIYSERNHVDHNIEVFTIMMNTTLSKFYAPNFYWITRLPAKIIATAVAACLRGGKGNSTNSVIKFLSLSGDDGINWLMEYFEALYGKTIQAPNFYYTYKKIYTGSKKDMKFRLLGYTPTSKIELPYSKKIVSISEIASNKLECSTELSNICLQIFEGKKELKTIARSLDYLLYAEDLIKNSKEVLAILQAEIKDFSSCPGLLS